MLHIIPWHPLRAVLVDSLRVLLARIPLPIPFLRPTPRMLPPPQSQIPVYVMLPLDTALPHPDIPFHLLNTFLKALHSIGVRGVMVDIWWGICEPNPGEYTFDAYLPLFEACREIGLQIQATISFHACGGNVGDAVNIPLPHWVRDAAAKHHFWFTDREGFQNPEYISFGADHEPCLPVPNDACDEVTPMRLRTPLQAYGAFMNAFVQFVKSKKLLGSVITELQIGMGPCGELRYPSYPLLNDMWSFPGIGEYQCFDKYMLNDLQQTVRQKGTEAVKAATLPPTATGRYNDTPWATDFFTNGFKTESGTFFQNWYCSKMLEHCEDVLRQARSVIPQSQKSVALAVKISGVHWWRFTASRAAEATAGYMMSGTKTAYQDIAKLFKTYNVVLDFTCLEMRTIDQPFLRARCGPRQLVGEVFRHARKEGIVVAGENALERLDWAAFAQIVSAYKFNRCERHGFTLLRLSKKMMDPDNLRNVERFVKVMRRVK
ncbi:Beta-amylase 3, chloroplastic [Gracilariopsis chorda]|uniref:Beta-amylase n=1 Tax=Gracilariopsis chorda TaxID=448386 RepID=A0A2V3IX95_9FLOR|nr:Beta-amylase 3, chloroplastic [Gracilariopsis chorda]|eukprot:PXF46683.1 Beta-amylase 3, chloroplastic [Gracilariopsis chorda]